MLARKGRDVTLSCVIPHRLAGATYSAVNRTFKSQNGERGADLSMLCGANSENALTR